MPRTAKPQPPDNYYTINSALQHLAKIRKPTLILTAKDDPLVPSGCFQKVPLSDFLLLHVTEHGGHLGYVAKSGVDADRRWMDWRIVDWVTANVPVAPNPNPSPIAAVG